MASKYWHGRAFVRFSSILYSYKRADPILDDSCTHSRHENGNLEHRKDLHKDLKQNGNLEHRKDLHNDLNGNPKIFRWV